jgi:hypothetical protein
MTAWLKGTIFLVLLLGNSAWAEIYKTTDKEGNTVFTDAPPTEGSEVVDLPEANIADSVEPAPRPAIEQTPAPQPASAGSSGATYEQQEQSQEYDDDPYIVYDDPDAVDARRVRERKEAIIEGDGPREVRKGPVPHRAPQVHRR